MNFRFSDLKCYSQYMHVAPQLSVGTAYKQDTQPRGVSMIMSSDSSAVPYGMVPQFSTLQIGSSVSLKFAHEGHKKWEFFLTF